MTGFVGRKFFSCLDEHALQNEELEFHSNHLMKAIVEKYLNVRMHYIAKNTTERLHLERVR